MDLTKAVTQLHHQGEAILSMCAVLSEPQSRWKPDAEDWSVLEVMAHLLKEERLDFRRHLGVIFQQSQPVWPELDPQQWQKRKTKDPESLQELLGDFKTERETSIAWLNVLQNPDWEAAITFEWGSLSAGDLLASWLAHDILHLRQLTALLYHLTAGENQPFQVVYAGQW